MSVASTVDTITPLRATYTADTWRGVYTAVFKSFFDVVEREQAAADGSYAPKLTNREAAALAAAWHMASLAAPGSERGLVWYQFVAHAYGWDPPRRDYMRRDEVQAEGWYPVELTKDLWNWAYTIAMYLDDTEVKPGLYVQRDAFGNPIFAGTIRSMLMEDGADAKFKFPSGYCKEKKTGKRRTPHPPCDDKGRGPLLGVDKSGKPIYGVCDKPGDCPPELLDDPFTVSGRNLATFLMWMGVAWLVLTPNKRRRR